MKRSCLRSIRASMSISGAPPTWLRRPSSVNFSTALMPLLPSRREASTVARSLPMHETMPAPVIGYIDFLAIRQQAGIANGHDQLALDDALDVDFVGDELHVRAHFARELDLARTQRTAPAGQLQPGQVKTDELPHGIEPQAAGHDRVALKVAGKEPQVGFDIELDAM